MSRKTKSPEIQRLIQLMESMNETPETLADKTGVSARTISNYIWNDSPIGGPLLRALAEIYEVSLDWLVTGRGDMDFDGPLPVPSAGPVRLIPQQQEPNLRAVGDVWWKAALVAEQALIDSDAVAGKDYEVLDLFKLARPFAVAAYQSGDAVLDPLEASRKPID